ncbi:SprT family protein [Chungangia koreensis]|uniref:Protein SprT-like n=1 Tax=Chungangia koreensis TaxID=752657 RepID=A0ABV8X4X7_9LACT
MNDLNLQRLVSEISESLFGKPFRHKAYFNPKLRSTGGRYLLGSHNIEINPKAYKKYGLEELEGIIKHELCHYHLHIEGKGYKHRDADFRKLLKETNAPRFCSDLREIQGNQRPYKNMYICTECGTKFKRKIRMDVKKYRCGRCKGRIVLTETQA